MAQELYTRTNQKMFFAGLALEVHGQGHCKRAMNAQGWSRPSASRRCSTCMVRCWAVP
jgi:hypothetical protein